MSRPSRRCRKSTGPLESRRIAIAIVTITGASRTIIAEAMTQSRLRFRSRDDGDSRLGGRPTSGETLERVDAGLRTDDLEQARHDVDLHVELPQLADRSELFLVVGVGERDDHALDVEHRDDLGQAVGRPDEREVLELGPARPRVRVDEADEVDAVLRVLEELPRRELADVAGADDDRVLEVERTAPGDRAREPAGRRHEDDGEQPEEDEPRHVRARAAGEPRGDEERPRAERDELEDADDLVDRRVVDVLLVAVVQPVELGRDDPERQRQHEDGELNPGMRAAPAGRRSASRADTRGSGRQRRRRAARAARTSRGGAQDVDRRRCAAARAAIPSAGRARARRGRAPRPKPPGRRSRPPPLARGRLTPIAPRQPQRSTLSPWNPPLRG